LLTRLSQGPSESDRARGLGTALTPDANVYVVAAVGPGIVIELDFGEQSLSAERLPLAVGQIVLTATSVPDVEQVRILSDGEPLEVPLPGGALTDGPLRQSDYSELLADAATNSPATGR
jgi:spore germination protein GerM